MPKWKSLFLLSISLSLVGGSTYAQDRPYTGEGIATSPFPAPEANDMRFVVGEAPGLDTGCTFSSGGPLVFEIPVTRYIGDRDTLLEQDLISDTMTLVMPAFDVDFDAVTSFAPERDLVYFNNHEVGTKYLVGLDDTWILNTFEIPTDWVKFPDVDPGPGGSVQPAMNEIRIEIDVDNPGKDIWCTSIDWASLALAQAPRPIVFVHGIFSSGQTWSNPGPGSWSGWPAALDALGIPHTGAKTGLIGDALDMGSLSSIDSNADKIAAKVAQAQARFGVDKVNLVCHSKGGIDSRHFAETTLAVERLIQVGTPNAGAPLADYVQTSLLELCLEFPLVCVSKVAITLLAGPAGIQLSQPYMAIYNANHTLNPKVSYAALSTEFIPDCFILNPLCAFDKWLVSLYSGNGDTIVPTTSVYALDFAHLVPLTLVGGSEAKHTSQTSSGKVFNKLIPLIAESGTSAVSAVAGRPGLAMPSNRTPSVVGLLAAGGDDSHVLSVDQSGPASFVLFYSTGELGLKVTSPGGVVYDEASAKTDPGVAFSQEPLFDASLATLRIDAAAEGEWTIQVNAGSVVEPGGTPYAVCAFFDSSAIDFEASFADPHVASGDELVLRATLAEAGRPVAGAVVDALVRLPDETLSEVMLLDDGVLPDEVADDGTYTGALTALQPGTYAAAFSATAGTVSAAGVPPFLNREDFGIATASAGTASVGSDFIDFGVDDDGDGLFNRLVVQGSVTVDHKADYSFIGILVDNLGTTYPSKIDATLLAGTTTVGFEFDGNAIYSQGIDGPYDLAEVRVIQEDEFDLLPVLVATDVHQTQAFAFSQFEHAGIQLTGVGFEQTLDPDLDGDYDSLELRIEALVDTPDFYQWSGRLEDSLGVEIDLAAGSGVLSAGASELVFDFDGASIGANAEDGPYLLSDVVIFGSTDSLVVPEAVYGTSAYDVVSFEGFAGAVKSLGCGINPPGTLTLTSGAPVAGSRLSFGVDNPFGTQTPGATPYLAITSAADPNFPCGTEVPGLGMAGFGAPAEVLVSLDPASILEPCLAGPLWVGPGVPSVYQLRIPADPVVVGANIFFQAALLDLAVGTELPVGLTEALRLIVGP